MWGGDYALSGRRGSSDKTHVENRTNPGQSRALNMPSGRQVGIGMQVVINVLWGPGMVNTFCLPPSC